MRPRKKYRNKNTVTYGKPLEWNEISIGQAFYFTGCQGFGVKTSTGQWTMIAYANIPGECIMSGWLGLLNAFLYCGRYKYYSIPKQLRECLEPQW